jgi:phosphoglycolate phosphatase
MKIVIFDMDGTLIDSQKDITISINYVRQKNHDLEPLSEAFVVASINKELRNLPYLFYGTELYEQKDKLAFEDHYAKQCTKNLYLYDGIREMLEHLDAAGVKLSVATNAPTKFAKIMLRSLGVIEFFDLVIGADKVAHSKPDPEMLHKILSFYHYDAQVDQAWMIGDNSKDMLSAKNAAIGSLFATWGFSPTSDGFREVCTPQEIIDIVL